MSRSTAYARASRLSLAPPAPRPASRTRSAYSDAASLTACPPSASSWLTCPDGDSRRSTLAMTSSDTSPRQIGRIISAVTSMSRPKYVA
jgi:hypothetical protein